MPPLPPRGEGAIFVRGKEKFAKNGMSAAPPALTPAKSPNPEAGGCIHQISEGQRATLGSAPVLALPRSTRNATR